MDTDNRRAAERIPYTGAVVDYRLSSYPTNPFGRRNVWEDVEIPQADLDQFVEDYNSIKWGRFRKNLLGIDFGTPGNVSPFDAEISKVTDNLQKIGRAVAKTDLAGVKADIEGYTVLEPWQHSTRPDVGSHDFVPYQAQCVTFGQNCANALLPELSGKTLVLIYGYEVMYDRDGGVVDTNAQYGLYPPWLDGFLGAAANYPDVRILFGGEDSYIWRKGLPSPVAPATLSWYGNNVRDETILHSSQPNYAITKLGRMQGIWIDYLHPDYWTSETLLQSMLNAAEYSTDGIWTFADQLKTNRDITVPVWMTRVFEEFLERTQYESRPQIEIDKRLTAIVVTAANRAQYETILEDAGYGAGALSISLSSGTHFAGVLSLTENGYHFMRGKIEASSDLITRYLPDGTGFFQSWITANGLTL